ncbi:Sugar transporter [Dimargaris cristalligena]|uniref:Sugar transporter SWEET1 n=1 Tax=Dimargaris cristalligena TaxID=215637 RepID=A0A4P9ZPR7_9FUNG|nr:Sugar transporter [Dimargaris cristalligena]RKP35434.1 sugar efflux transporter for intercellular exchange-domain-containing protein [Dimargaris cristalligena]|eukprot:RKP35434.1 sugar efflux transporter for intercellular exchange-domain-containing protein [Dimargaris cristalligena]
MLVIESFATVFTAGMFLSGLTIVKRIKSGPSIVPIPSFPAFATLVNCLLWCKYGLVTHDVLMVLVNTIGVITSIYLLYNHYFFTKHQNYLEKSALIAASLVTVLFIYVDYLAGTRATNHLGLACCLSCVIMFSSPLVSIRTVVTTHSTYTLSFPLSVTSFLTSSLWALYGYTIHDSFVFAPNFAGAVLATIQVSMFAIYRNRDPAPAPAETPV